MENDHNSDNHLFNLSNLLREMCDFLTSIMHKLPPPIQEQANLLIKKTQADADFGHYLNMQKISIEETNSTINEYVLADNSKSNEYIDPNENEDQSYENPDSINSKIVIESIEPIERNLKICKYDNLSAQQLCTMAVKIGLLNRKEKVFLYVEVSRKYFVGLLDIWLLFYGSEKDDKPNKFLNMLDYRASPLMGTKDDKKLSSFELISIVEGNKSYQLMALTPKDMQQWVACINRAKTTMQTAPTCTVSKKNLRRLPQPPDDIDQENEGLYMDVETESNQIPARLSNESYIYDEVGTGTYYASATEEPDEEHYDDIGQFKILPKSTSFLHRRRFNI